MKLSAYDVVFSSKRNDLVHIEYIEKLHDTVSFDDCMPFLESVVTLYEEWESAPDEFKMHEERFNRIQFVVCSIIHNAVVGKYDFNKQVHADMFKRVYAIQKYLFVYSNYIYIMEPRDIKSSDVMDVYVRMKLLGEV